MTSLLKLSAERLLMARIVPTEGFVDDLAQVWSCRVTAYIRESLEALQTFPRLGAADLPKGIKRTYGDSVRRLSVPPFDLIYEFDEEADSVYVYALVPCRRMH